MKVSLTIRPSTRQSSTHDVAKVRRRYVGVNHDCRRLARANRTARARLPQVALTERVLPTGHNPNRKRNHIGGPTPCPPYSAPLEENSEKDEDGMARFHSSALFSTYAVITNSDDADPI